MANPFQYKEPLSGKQGFGDRRSELMRIASRITAERPQSVSVVGERKIGKTSLLNRFCAPGAKADFLDEPDRYLFLYLDLRHDSPGKPEAFFAHLSRAWQQQGGGGIAPTFDGFNSMVKELMQDGRKLLLFLDDFGLITQNNGFPLGFFSFMRSVANSHDVGYVTTSETDLQKLCYTPDIEESPFFNIFTTVHLEPFKEKDARQLVEGLSATGGAPFGEETDWILALAGGSPYLLQLTGSLAFDARSRGRFDQKSLAEAAFKEARDFLACLWEGMTPVQQEVLRNAHAGKEVERRHEYAAEQLLRRGHLVQEEGKYRLRSALLARLVKERRGGGLWKRLFG